MNQDSGRTDADTASAVDKSTQTAGQRPPLRPAPTEAHPTQIGPYKILEVLGEGGMGVVYLAEQSKPIHRRVALKIIKLGMDTKQVIARFETEREALALMNHPNVAKVFDAGATETGRPYFAMEYVAGIPITDYCDKHRLNTKERLRLFMDVCHAVQHAHQKGIIHRDIKPSNVLVTVQDDKPVPKVIDFGIAKATQQKLSEQTMFTETGQFVGTPAYMSPEQAGAAPADIDTRTDVYSLGVLLYELLVGARPFDDLMLRSAALAEIQRIIREVEPPKPSTKLSAMKSEPGASAAGGTGLLDTVASHRSTQPSTLLRQLRGDLDWIVMKCLEKDRTRRYETANGLALEIQRYLNQEPVLAGPPSAVYRVRKFVRRNKGPVAGVSAIVAALATGLIISDLQRRRAVRAEALADQRLNETESALGQAEAARHEAEAVTRFLTDTLSAADPEKQGKDVTVREVLDKAADQIGEKFADKPLIEARVRQTISQTYGNLGLYDRMEEHSAAAAAIYRAELGPRDPRTLGAAGQFASSLKQRGQYGPAVASHRATLEIQRRVFGDEHPQTLALTNNLATALESDGRHGEAEELNRKILDIRRRVLGEEHADTLSSMNNLATALHSQGLYVECEELNRKTLEIMRRIRGEEHPDTLTSMNNLANVFCAQGKYAEAEQLHRKNYEIERRVLGEEHPDTLISMNNLAVILHYQGKYAEVGELHRKTLDIRRRVLGEEHPDTLISMNNLAGLLADQSKYAEAEELGREALELHSRVLGEQHPETLASMNNLAISLFGQGTYAEAGDLFRKTLDLQRRVLGEEHPDTMDSLVNLAELLHITGKFAESESLYREAVERCRLRAEQENASAEDLQVYAFLLLTCEVESLRNPSAALPPAQRAVEMTGRRNADVLDALALAYHRTGQSGEAVETQREALALLPPAPTPLRAEMESRLGEYLTAHGRFAEAEPLLNDSFQWMAETMHATQHTLKDFAERLVKLYESWDAAEPGKGYAEKAAEWRGKLDELNAETQKRRNGRRDDARRHAGKRGNVEKSKRRNAKVNTGESRTKNVLQSPTVFSSTCRGDADPSVRVVTLV